MKIRRTADTEMRLATGGPLGSKQQNLWCLSATATDAAGDTNTLTGIVERTGNVWVENLPLNSGTNLVTLQVMNAAGLSNATNFTVVKSGMALTLDNITGDLWLPTVSVSGTISDTNAPVFVNGVEGTNNGDGTWNASNVPVSAGGMACFKVSTSPTSPTNPNISYDTAKADELITESGVWGNWPCLGLVDRSSR